MKQRCLFSNYLKGGRNCVATAQTGSGKTGAFMIPIIEKVLSAPVATRSKILAVVLAPSRELAEQIGAVGRALTKALWPSLGLKNYDFYKITIFFYSNTRL